MSPKRPGRRPADELPKACRTPNSWNWPGVTASCSTFIQHRADISRVTFWGVTDGDSWLNAPHRANYPLLFDRSGQPKPAFQAVLDAAR